MPATSPDSLATHRRERAIWQGAGVSILAKAVSALCQLAQVPVAIHYLGSELFGLWMTLTSVLALMNFADLGVGAGMQNEAAAALGRDQAHEARRTLSSGVALLAGLAAALAVVLVVLVQVLPLARLLGVSDPAQLADARTGLLVMAGLFCVNLPLTVVGRVAAGLQLTWLSTAWFAVINVLTLICVLAASGLKLGFVGFIAVAAVPPVVGNMCLVLHVFRKLGWSFATLPPPVWGDVRRLLRSGLPFMLPQLGALALTSVPPVLIAAQLGPAAVTTYNLCQRLLGLFAQVQAMVLTPMWPAFTEAWSRGDVAWLRKNYGRMMGLSAVFVSLPQALFFVWGGLALTLWTRGNVVLDGWTALGFGLFSAAASLSQPPAFLLNGLGRAKGQGIYALGSVLLILGIGPWSLQTWGLSGFVFMAATFLSLINLPCIYTEARLCLKV